MIFDRRRFIRDAGAGAGVLALTSFAKVRAAEPRSMPKPPGQSHESGLPPGWREMRKLDAHNHVMVPVHRPNASWSAVENLVEAAEAMGIATLFCSHPVSAGARVNIEVVRDANDSVLAAMKRYPGRIGGYCFVQPGNGAAALDEIERCLDAGMIGVKLYNQYKYTDPVVFPIAEKCIEKRIPFLGHSAYITDPRGLAAQPLTSNSLDFCKLSSRYPKLLLILGHISGGGDWEWAIKALRGCPNVFVDTSGSVQENDTIERCVRELGHERVLFATDLSIEGGVGKILSAELTNEQRKAIFWRNFQRILDRRKS